jgi:hypothetical protein
VEEETTCIHQLAQFFIRLSVRKSRIYIYTPHLGGSKGQQHILPYTLCSTEQIAYGMFKREVHKEATGL